MADSAIMNLALNLIARNPNVSNNPNAKALINVIQSGDASQGEMIADNICKTYGVPREEAVANAKSFFKIY